MNRFSVAGVLLAGAALSLGYVLAQDGPESVIRGTKRFDKRVLASGLAGPWEITWGPDNMLWVTERTGKRVVRIDPATGAKTTAATISEVSAPGGQDGLLGMALHPDLLRGSGSDYVYVGYTYVDQAKGANPMFPSLRSPYRYLYGKIVRFEYDKAAGTLSKPKDLVTGLPAGNDHVAGRLKIGPDRKLYYTIGDLGHNQLGNFCLPIEAQRLPTQDEVKSRDYAAYVGKSLRLNLDGSIPDDNPKLNGAVSHVFTYGHRNPQGLDFGPDGTLYSSEQGPKTDDEVNILKSGSNYGWPHVAGLKDGNAYEYARWAESTTPCSQLSFSDLAISPTVPRESESAYTKPFVEPIATMFTVPSNYNFHDPACKGVDFICWPTTGSSNIEYFASSGGKGIPGWDKVLLITTLKRGSVYVLPLTADGQKAAGHMSRYFQSENRYRDTAISPDGKTIYVATDPGGLAESMSGGATTKMQDPGAILAFTYAGEGGTAVTSNQPRDVTMKGKSDAGMEAHGKMAPAGTPPPSFTAAQAAAGKTAYNANCAVCHGSNMTNGTFAPPLAGEYFKNAWSGRTVRGFYEKSRAMPPAAPASLPEDVYANIVAYVLTLNGFTPGSTPLPTGADSLDRMALVHGK